MNKEIFTDEEEQIKEVIIASRKLEEYLWGEYNGQWNIEEWRRMFRKREVGTNEFDMGERNTDPYKENIGDNIKIDDIDINNPHAIIEMRKRVMQNAALSVALMKILDTKGIPTDKCVIPSNLPQYAINEKGDATNE